MAKKVHKVYQESKINIEEVNFIMLNYYFNTNKSWIIQPISDLK